MSGNKLLGGCAKGPQWTYDGAGNICVSIPNCVTGEDLKIPPTPEIPEDLFTKCEISADGLTATLTIPEKQAPLVLCLDPVKGAVLVADEGTQTVLEVIDGVLQIPEAAPICWGLNADGCPVLGIPNCITGEDLVIGSVQSVTGNVVDNTDPKNPVITAVASVTGDGVDNTDPLNPVVNIPEVPEDILTSMIQDSVTGDITYTDEQGIDSIATTKHSTTVPSADGTYHTITTDDGVPTVTCVDQFKGLRDNGDGTFTEQFLGQDGVVTDGGTFQYVQDTDQRLTNPVITQNTVDGVTTHTITWDIIDIDGNVIGQETATGIQMPVFVDKAGVALTGPISPLLAAQFAAGEYIAGDKLMVLSTDGSCKLVDLPERTCCINWCVFDTNGSRFTALVEIVGGVPQPVTYLDIDTALAAAPVGALTRCDDIVLPDPVTVTSSDDSVTVVPTATGYDVTVTHPDPVTVGSSDDSVSVTPTATGYDITVTHPDFPVIPDPVTVASSDGSVTVTPTATGYDVTVPVVDTLSLLYCDGSEVQEGDTIPRQGEGLVKLPTIPCPPTCIPDDPACLTGFYFIQDETGAEWEWNGAGPWVKTQKTRYRKRDTLPSISSPVDFQSTDYPGQGSNVRNIVLITTDPIVIENPTCDAMDVVFEGAMHGEVFWPKRDDAGTLDRIYVWAEYTVNGGTSWIPFLHMGGLQTATRSGTDQWQANQFDRFLGAKSDLTIQFRIIGHWNTADGVPSADLWIDNPILTMTYDMVVR